MKCSQCGLLLCVLLNGMLLQPMHAVSDAASGQVEHTSSTPYTVPLETRLKWIIVWPNQDEMAGQTVHVDRGQDSDDIPQSTPSASNEPSGILISRTLDEHLSSRGVYTIGRVVGDCVAIEYEIALTNQNELCAQLVESGCVRHASPNHLSVPTVTPNDPHYSSDQWHHVTLNSPIAWDYALGNPSVLVAVCDSGVEASHPDLAGNLQLPGYNSVDTSTNTEAVTAHGTWVAGVLGAIGNNASHVAGMAWSPSILPIRVSNSSSGSTDMQSVMAAVEEAARRQAKVVNVSYGPTYASAIPSWFQALDIEAQKVVNAGGLVFKSAGNQRVEVFGSDYDSFITVGATDQNDDLSVWSPTKGSNWGEYIDVVAPGTDIYTLDLNGGVTNKGGTSFSSPTVAGIAALLWSYDPNLAPSEVKNLIFDSCVDIGAPGEDNYYGHGRVDAGAALRLLAERRRRGSPADLDGDGIHDLCILTQDRYWHYHQSSDGAEFSQKWGIEHDAPVPGDYEGVNRDNFAVWRSSTGEWIVRKHDGSAMTHALGSEADIPVPADFDGDGITDFAVFSEGAGTWTIHPSLSANYSISFGQSRDVPFAFDAFNPDSGVSYDADSLPDLVVWRPEIGDWFIKCSNGGAEFSYYWGTTADKPYPGDYDGDGITDFCVYRESDQYWRGVRSGDGSTFVQKWGIAGDVACPGRYEGSDAVDDLAIYRSGRFHVQQSSTGVKLGEPPVFVGGVGDAFVPGNFVNATDVGTVSFDLSTGWWYSGYADGTSSSDKWGIGGDIPVPADYDSDGVVDRAVYRAGWWYVSRSSGGTTADKWGIAGDTPVPADYDNDGTIDRAVYRDGWWYVDGMASRKWGLTTDVPYPGHYDSDGILDLAVYRPSTGQWIASPSSLAPAVVVTCGDPSHVPADQPIPADYDGDGLTSPAVFVPGTDEWQYVSSASGYASINTLSSGTGNAADVAVLADYDNDGVKDLGVVNGVSTAQWHVDLSTGGKMPDPRMGIDLPTTGVPLGSR